MLFNFNNNICCLNKRIKDKYLNKCKIIKGSKKPVIKNMYYLPHIDNKNNISNDLSLNKNLIITGPNASGKTTMLKSTIINLFLSQNIPWVRIYLYMFISRTPVCFDVWVRSSFKFGFLAKDIVG